MLEIGTVDVPVDSDSVKVEAEAQRGAAVKKKNIIVPIPEDNVLPDELLAEREQFLKQDATDNEDVDTATVSVDEDEEKNT